MKANSNLAVLRLMAKEGSGVDIVSGGELYRALKAGVPPTKIVFAGVGKKAEEIAEALKADILMFNVESPAELQAINEVAASLGVKARVAFAHQSRHRSEDASVYFHRAEKSKFGIAADRAIEEFKAATAFSHIKVVGLHAHIGSQLTQVTPLSSHRRRCWRWYRPWRSREFRCDTSTSVVDWGLPIPTKHLRNRKTWPRRFRLSYVI